MKKSLFAVVFCLVLLVGASPLTCLAAKKTPVDSSLTYYTYDLQTNTNVTEETPIGLTRLEKDTTSVGTAGLTTWAYYEGTVKGSSLTVNGIVNLVLKNECLVKLPKGLTVSENATLHIYSQSWRTDRGTLQVSSPENGVPAINLKNGSSLILDSGQLNVTGADDAVAVGTMEQNGSCRIQFNCGASEIAGGKHSGPAMGAGAKGAVCNISFADGSHKIHASSVIDGSQHKLETKPAIGGVNGGQVKVVVGEALKNAILVSYYHVEILENKKADDGQPACIYTQKYKQAVEYDGEDGLLLNCFWSEMEANTYNPLDKNALILMVIGVIVIVGLVSVFILLFRKRDGLPEGPAEESFNHTEM